MAEVTYIFGEMRTGAIIGDIDLSDVSSATSKLNDWGSFKGSFPLDQSGKSNSDLVAAVVPGKNFLVVERDGNPVWGGLIWGCTYQSQAKRVEVNARTLEAYPERQRIRTDMAWTDFERRNILIDAWNAIQSVPERNLGVEVPAYLPDANLTTISVAAIDRSRYFSLISQVADGASGFDWRIEWTKSSSGYYRKTLLIGSPLLGNGDPTQLGFEYPGAITNYYETQTMAESATHISAIGAGSGVDLIASDYTHQDLIDSGQWLAYDLDVSRKEIVDQNTLDDAAMQEGIRRRPPMTVQKVFVKADQDPQYGSYALGDACRVIIVDARHPNGAEVDARIVAISYNPPSDDGVEEVELIFEGDSLNE